jgi:hypothetical protein
LPHKDLLAALRRVPGRVLWPSAIGFVLLALFVLFRPRQSVPFGEPAQVPLAQMPNTPPGYEVSPGELPGNDNRTFRSALTVPPGYALTVAPILLSNQVPVKTLAPNLGAVVIAPAGQPVHAQLTWHLLGGTTLADGAPLQFSLALLEPLHDDKSFQMEPPEPVLIDWVTEPAQLWPPQNGHTRFVLMKGVSTAPAAELPLQSEWTVAIEARLDPIPENVSDSLRTPRILLGTNWLPQGERGSILPNSVGDASAKAALWDMKIARYLQACNSIDQLATREKELLTQFTSENTFVKTVREELAAQQQIKRQLEAELKIHKPQVQGEIPAVKP